MGCFEMNGTCLNASDYHRSQMAHVVWLLWGKCHNAFSFICFILSAEWVVRETQHRLKSNSEFFCFSHSGILRLYVSHSDSGLIRK